jgi:DNA-directed RNA polymerase subunit M/transcription elongation factor TFIIS
MAGKAIGIVKDFNSLVRSEKVIVDLSNSDDSPRKSCSVKHSDFDETLRAGDKVLVEFVTGTYSHWVGRELLERQVEPERTATPEGDSDHPCPKCGANSAYYATQSARRSNKRQCLNPDCQHVISRSMPTG